MAQELLHYGMPRRSGRYPWGSGKDPYQSAIGFLGTVRELRQKGLGDTEIARGLGMTTSQFRARNSLATAEVRAAQRAEVLRLSEKGMSNVAIGERMGLNESTIRSLKNPILAERAAITAATSNALKESIAKFKYIDVGAGVENHIGVSRTKLNTAIAELVEQGYKLHYVKVEQAGMPGQFTSIKVLASPESTYSEVFRNKDLIQPIKGRSDDFGRTYSDLGLKPIQSVNDSRIQVRYHDEGGALKDGVIELRRGVEDLDLGNAAYAQVRIGVNNTHYLKGMAIYSDDMPDGVDIIFNTNKHPGGSKLDAMKKMKDDPDNPFGTSIKRILDDEGNSVPVQRGAINVVNEEGDWSNWSRSISSQVLSKQSAALAKQQLDLAYQLKVEEFHEILSLTNPAVRKQLLDSFADDCDSSAVHLKAAALPRQSNKVILPVPSLGENEVYAPSYNDGETVVLIRHPHGGTFEIPQLTVNNRNKEGRSILGTDPLDAIGINPKSAQKLSGADFDGDTVLVIPNPHGQIRTKASLKALQNFDTIEAYPPFDGMKTIDGGIYRAASKTVDYGDRRPSSQTMQTKMGEISNLITDMTIKGANLDEIARAVKHSMVIIDSEKHHLNYKQSQIDNGISALAEKYQGSKRGGASTLISQASSEVRVLERKNRIDIDPKTGQKIFTETGESYIDRKGREVFRTTKTTKMAEATWDPELNGLAFKGKRLSSGTPIESTYENHANQLKAMANTARKESLATKPIPYSPSAKQTYSTEVQSLRASLNIAQKNKPLERQAQIMTESIVKRKIQDNPGLDSADIKKIRGQALAESRVRAGAKKQQIEISPKEWAAIQAGAVSNNTLIQILNNTDLDVVKKYATPRTSVPGLSEAKINRAKTMMASGYTQAEVAQILGVSISTLSNAVYD